MGRPRKNPDLPDKSALYIRLEFWACQRERVQEVTITKLAGLLDVPRAVLGAWRTSTNVPTRYYIDHLYEVTKISRHELMGLRDEMEESLEADRALQLKARRAAKQQQPPAAS